MEKVILLKHYGDDFCLVAVIDRTAWSPEAQVHLTRRRKTAAGIVYDPQSFDRSPAYQEIERTLRSLGLNVCPR